MRHLSSPPSLLSLSRIGILAVAIHSMTAAPQQDKAPGSTEQATVAKLLSDSSAAGQRKDYEAERQTALKATAIDPRNVHAWFNVAYANAQLGDLPKAEAAYKTLIGLSPKHTIAYNNLGVVYRRMGRTEEAIACDRKQLEVAPRSR